MKLPALVFLTAMAMSVDAAQFNESGKIDSFRSYGDTNTYKPTFIQIQNGSTRPLCASASFNNGATRTYFMIKPEEKELLSTALAAAAAGKQVRITSNDDTNLKHNGEVCRVLYIDVQF